MRGERITESGKHGEGSGHAEGRNKRGSVGGFVSGVRRRGNVGRNWNHRIVRTESHTIFVDNLPAGVAKRELYKEFGKDGSVNDIFMSRKSRRNANCPFAFVRFNEYAGAMRAIDRLNGTFWGEGKLFITLSKFKRDGGVHGGCITKWLGQSRDRDTCRNGVKVMNFLLDEWKGPREIECRDVGPYRCLDDKTQEAKSFSMARILLDCFQWEKIHEEDDDSVSMDDPRSMSEGEETLITVEETPATTSNSNSNSNWKNVDDPLINVIINSKWNNVQDLIHEREFVSHEDGESVFEVLSMKVIPETCYVKGVRCELMGCDPVIIEAQIAASKKKEVHMGMDHIGNGPVVNDRRSVDENGLDSGSSNTYPFPPGFGPEGARGADQQIVSGCLVVWEDRIPETPAIVEKEEVSNETLYRINVLAIKDALVGDDAAKDSVVEDKSLPAQIENSIAACNDEESVSDETLYLINKSARVRVENGEDKFGLVGEQNSNDGSECSKELEDIEVQLN
ncbi:hypothetical protein PIB30_091605 [Stylosanthes scabra]|uniref:RRM domain-containing protein n=1 Tax=Stylosanthes scabra TaxID=79078 RepID=A0ABU6TVZ8_9FABA|nr:hypothetical protein [Stylosanthes scabra]